MALSYFIFIILLIWNGINSTTGVDVGSGESSGDGSGDSSLIVVGGESGEGSGEGSGETSTTDTTTVVSSGDGSGETTDDSYSGEGLIVTTVATIVVSTETIEGSSTVDGSGDTTAGVEGSGEVSATTSPTIDSGSGSGSGDETTTVSPEDGSGLTTDTTTGSGDGSGETTTTAGSENGSGETTDMTTDSGSGETTDMTTDAGSGETTTESSMPCNQATANARPLEIFDISMPSTITTSETFTIQFFMRDSTSGQRLDSLTWSDCSWTAAVTLSDTSSYRQQRSGFISATTSAAIDQNYANVTISGVSLSASGMAVLQITMTTNPSAYQLTAQYGVKILSTSNTMTSTKQITITFNLDFDTYGTEEMKATVYNYILSKENDEITLDIVLERGSVIVKVTLGSSSDSSITTITDAICTDFTKNTTLDYLGQSITMATVVIGTDGDNSCHVETSDDSSILVVGMVSGIIFCVISIVIILAILYWRFKIYPKRKIGSKEELQDEYEDEFIEYYDEKITEKQAEVIVKYLGTSHFVEEKLWRSSFSSLREKSVLADNPLAPISTAIPPNEKGHHSSYGPKFKKRSSVGSRKVAPVEQTEPLPPLMINGVPVNIPTKFSPFNFSFKK